MLPASWFGSLTSGKIRRTWCPTVKVPALRHVFTVEALWPRAIQKCSWILRNQNHRIWLLSGWPEKKEKIQSSVMVRLEGSTLWCASVGWSVVRLLGSGEAARDQHTGVCWWGEEHMATVWAFLESLKNRIFTLFSHPTLGAYSEELEAGFWKGICPTTRI